MSEIKNLIVSLARSGRVSPTAPPRAVTDVKPIDGQLGVGVSKKPTTSSVLVQGTVQTIFKNEVATAYSIIIITSDGAYEAPPNWPSNRLYPQEVGVMTVNDTIEQVGQLYGISDSATIYEQKRVHASITVQIPGYQELTNYAIKYETPLQGFHRLGVDRAGMPYEPTVYSEEIGGDYVYDTSAFFK